MLCALLPERSREAIRSRAHGLGLVMKYRTWMTHEVREVRKRFRQGEPAAAARLWREAIAAAGAPAPGLYHRRLAAAEGGKAVDLPRD